MSRSVRAVISALIVAFIGPAAWAPTARAADAGALAGRTIVVDPGHGGVQPGASAFGVEEKALTLPISLDLGAALQQTGAGVAFTRTTDATVSLPARAEVANSRHADAFVAIHANSAPDPSIRGVTTFYGAPDGYADGTTRSLALVARSRALADDVQRAVVGATGQADRGVRMATFSVVGHAQVPAVLIETGFMTNPTEGHQLTTADFQRQIAQGIAVGLVAFLGGGVASATPTVEASMRTGVVSATSGAVQASMYTVAPASGSARLERQTAMRAGSAGLPRPTPPSPISAAIWVGGAALALSILGVRQQRVSTRRRRWMLRRRRMRRHASQDDGE